MTAGTAHDLWSFVLAGGRVAAICTFVVVILPRYRDLKYRLLRVAMFISMGERRDTRVTQRNPPMPAGRLALAASSSLD